MGSKQELSKDKTCVSSSCQYIFSICEDNRKYSEKLGLSHLFHKYLNFECSSIRPLLSDLGPFISLRSLCYVYFKVQFLKGSIISFCFLTYLSLRPFYRTYADSIAPDATPQNAASHLGLFCLLKEISKIKMHT